MLTNPFKVSQFLTIAVAALMLFKGVVSFLSKNSHCIDNWRSMCETATAVGLMKLEDIDVNLGLGDVEREDWDLALFEREDLYSAANLALDCFYSPRIRLNFEGIGEGSLEYKFWRKTLSLYESIDKFDAWCGNYVGFSSRCNSRLDFPSLDVSRESVLLGATRRDGGELVGLIEICLEEPTGSLSASVANPFRKKLPIIAQEKPYICNLCVSTAHRRSGIANMLCRVSESIISEKWEYSEVYIHVESRNYGAYSLYRKLGYKPVLQPPQNVPDGILFYRKTLPRGVVVGSL